MSTVPTHPYESIDSNGYRTPGELLFPAEKTPQITKDIQSRTAQILQFPKKPKKDLPEISLAREEYLPSSTMAERDAIIGQILSREKFPSNAETLMGQRSGREKAETIIKDSLREMMRVAAKSDVENHIFWVGRLIPGFSADFKWSLKHAFDESLKKEFPQLSQDEKRIASQMVSQIHRNIQMRLLSDYGTIVVKDRNLYETIEDLNAAIWILRLKKDYWQWELTTAVTKNEIPAAYKERLFMLLEAFVDHYVATVWDIESALRNAPKSEMAKSA